MTQQASPSNGPDWLVPETALHSSQLALAAIAIAAGIGFARATLDRPRPNERTVDGARRSGTVEPVRIFAAGIVEGARPEISLGFEVSGRLRSVRVQEGDWVRAGSVLAELETDDAELRLAEASAQWRLAVAERERVLAANGPVRAVPPVAGGADSAAAETVAQRRRRAETRASALAANEKAELASAEARVALADAAVERERRGIAQATLRSPCEGVLLAVEPAAGELVGPADRALFVLGDDRRFRVRAFVEEFDALRVAVGQRATIVALGAPSKSYAGTVRSCAPGVHPKAHSHFKPGEFLDVRVREIVIELEDGSGLLIGLPVEAFLEHPATRPMFGPRSGCG